MDVLTTSELQGTSLGAKSVEDGADKSEQQMKEDNRFQQAIAVWRGTHLGCLIPRRKFHAVAN